MEHEDCYCPQCQIERMEAFLDDYEPLVEELSNVLTKIVEEGDRFAFYQWILIFKSWGETGKNCFEERIIH